MTKEEEDSKGEVVSKGEKKKISVLKKKTKSLSRILGGMQQELDVLTAIADTSFRKRGAKMSQ
jgi:ribosomal protein L21